MGSLSPVRIIRQLDKVVFDGYVWVSSNGYLEAFWREHGKKRNAWFSPQGVQLWPSVRFYKMDWLD